MSTSMPSTCTKNNKAIKQVSIELQNMKPFKDPLMFILYSGHASNLLCALIEECKNNLASSYPTEGVKNALETYKVSESGSSLCHLRIVFFLLLSRDSVTRKKLCESKISWYLPVLCPHKACRFFDELDNIVIPRWVRDETVGLVDFEEMLKESYLNA